MKIFDTQLKALTEKLTQYDEDIEDAARILAQSIVSDGRIYWYGENEMKGIVTQACLGEDRIADSFLADESTSFSAMDTLVVMSQDLSENMIETLTNKAVQGQSTVIGIHSNIEDSSVVDLDFSFTTGVKNGLVPMESGNRIGSPHLLIGLHLYYKLYFAVMEMLEEHTELD
ncbi:hypothetical protein CR194_12420 [Salipaludibacillus keqinensis]|uniref:DUF2529 domain-containing protein n=1 Tax=Salipaludibacillus keqinensis TaxID=2045207 RepID=A0A323TAX3_9BACI|nr:DUF2529 family protein [Salipaludibacillus keqinensis]PYZ92471.1 hypothetical protein CR194_12420 [Salipaludibacillus keqinensis]